MSATSDGPSAETQTVDRTAFNAERELPYSLRVDDFALAMQDVYDFFRDVNGFLRGRGLDRLDDSLRAANLSGLLSDMLTASLAKHSRTLTVNQFPNGHPDLIVRGVYVNNAVQSGDQGVEIKTTRKAGGAVDTHGAREQWMCVFVYRVDDETEPAAARAPLCFTDVYLGPVTPEGFRRNERGALGTPTATLHAAGIAALREHWVYRLPADAPQRASRGRARPRRSALGSSLGSALGR